MRFSVKAMRPGEGLVALKLEAASPEQAAEQAQAQGYRVLSVAGGWRPWRTGRGAAFPLVLFSQELLALLQAGLPLVEAVETLADKEQRADTRRVMRQLIEELFQGKTFSQALAQHPAAFPPLYVATVRAAERTGDLPEALSRYIGYQTQLDAVRKKLIAASIYPLLLLCVGGLVTLFLLGYVVPRFSGIFADMGGDIPLLSKLLIDWGVFMQAHALPMGLAFLALIALAVHALRQREARRWVGRRLWRVPAIGERLRVYQLARFYRTVGMLLDGGIPVVTALGMVEGLLHPALRGALAHATADIREGKAISVAMEAHGLTTPVALRMLRVGERTGRMGEMMERIAGFYDEEMARWVDWFTRLFEPLLMALIGLVIGVIVVLMYMPIFELAGSIQ